MPRPMLVAAALLAVAGCATVPPGPISNPEGGTCRAIDQSRYVGQPATSELGAAMLRDSGARVLRWVAHGSVITMEFSPDRLTVRLDPQNRVESATCG